MKPFEYASARDVKEALALLGRDGTARVMAGGTDLLGLMKDYVMSPARAVSVRSLGGLRTLETRAGANSHGIEIGALVTVAELAASPALRDQFSSLAEAAALIGSPQIRNVATLGGNLCQRPRCWYFRNEHYPCLKKGGDTCYAEEGENKYHAIFGGGPCHIVHPSNLAPSLIAFDATIEIESAEGTRSVEAARFFTGPQDTIAAENILKPNEIVTRVRLPDRQPRWASAYLEAREKQDFDWPLASATVALQWDGKRCAEARVVLGAVAPIPWRSPAAEQVLRGQAITGKLAAAAGEAATRDAGPMSQNAYKIQIVRALVKRAVARAVGIEAEGTSS